MKTWCTDEMVTPSIKSSMLEFQIAIGLRTDAPDTRAWTGRPLASSVVARDRHNVTLKFWRQIGHFAVESVFRSRTGATSPGLERAGGTNRSALQFQTFPSSLHDSHLNSRNMLQPNASAAMVQKPQQTVCSE
jgi:hypothetical protein